MTPSQCRSLVNPFTVWDFAVEGCAVGVLWVESHDRSGPIEASAEMVLANVQRTKDNSLVSSPLRFCQASRQQRTATTLGESCCMSNNNPEISRHHDTDSNAWTLGNPNMGIPHPPNRGAFHHPSRKDARSIPRYSWLVGNLCCKLHLLPPDLYVVHLKMPLCVAHSSVHRHSPPSAPSSEIHPSIG